MAFFLALLSLGIALNFAWADSERATEHFQFRLPRPAAYHLEAKQLRSSSPSSKNEWLKAWPDGSSTNYIELGSRVVLQLKSGRDYKQFITGHALELARTVGPNIFILQAPDPLTAAREAHRLAGRREICASYPVLRRQVDLHGRYAYQPTDFFFAQQWQMEHRNTNGLSAGVDLNVRAAWPWSMGQGAIIAVADTGVELEHPELAARLAGAPHFNFATQTLDAGPISGSAKAAHGTEVAGLAAANINDARMVGVAPEASLASWVIFNSDFTLVPDDQLMAMYQYQSDIVGIQNHSWGNFGVLQLGPTLLEEIGISNAVQRGRSGLGVIMVRSAGSDRTLGASANDDGYAADPQVIAVAAVRLDGRVASYSEFGSCILLAAPSGDSSQGFNGLFTTDLLGTRGANPLNYFPPYQDLSGYVFDVLGFSGTSASAPQIAGVAALLLSINPNLSYRDVQQILILSSRHFDLADPDLVVNGAGFQVSHNDGFGVPDAGVAVDLARNWINRPPCTNITITASDPAEIPDDGLRLLITGDNVPDNVASVRTLPSVGPHADTPTLALPLVDFGFGTNLAGYNLTNKAALIQRGSNTALFATQINNAARAGAGFAVVYNFATNTNPNGAPGGDQLIPMGGTDFVPIRAVFIGNTDGEALKAVFQTNGSALAQIHLNTTNYVFTVTNTLICEHVGLRVMTDHPLRGDVRITLVSPAGTRSVLQRYNADVSPGPVDWTYYSTHHFFESSAGDWTVYFSDEFKDNVGTVQSVALTIYGVPIVDTDKDGLDDVWEMSHFSSLRQGPLDDPDRDGYSNAREQLAGTDPMAVDVAFKLDLSRWNKDLARLSWPGSSNVTYQVWGGTNLSAPNLITNLPARFPETEWFTPYSTVPHHFLRVRAVPIP